MSFETTSQPVLAAPVTESTPTAVPPGHPNLDYVFDDPADGEPGRDRMLVHGLWELVLAARAGRRRLPALPRGLGRVLRRRAARAAARRRGARRRGRGAAPSRCGPGAPNLAVGAVAVAAALYFGRTSDGGLLQPLLIVIGHLRRHRRGPGPGRRRTARAGLGGEPRRRRSCCSPGRAPRPTVTPGHLLRPAAARVLLVRRLLRAERRRRPGRAGADGAPRRSAGSGPSPTRPTGAGWVAA